MDAIATRIPRIIRCMNNSRSADSFGLSRIAFRFITTSSEVSYVATNIPTIFTSPLLHPEVELASYTARAQSIFKLPSIYVSPIQLNYALPTGTTPEFAFIGRSNVGKSSLICTLLRNPSIVRTSKEPGCTKSINYFSFVTENSKSGNLSHRLYLVDLPGYGFAKVSKDERSKWKGVIDGYILTRPASILRRIFLLIDSRHGLKKTDEDIMKMLTKARIAFQIVLTKSDLSTSKEKHDTLNQVFDMVMKKKASTCLPFVFMLSSKTLDGIAPLQYTIAEIDSQNWGHHHSIPHTEDDANALEDNEVDEGKETESFGNEMSNPQLANDILNKIPKEILASLGKGGADKDISTGVIDRLNKLYNAKRKGI